MIQVIIELPGVENIKEKRRIVNSMKERLQRKFRISVAEIDLQESLGYSQIGAALISNSRTYGESVMQKVLLFVEDETPGRVQDVQILSETY